MKDFLTCTWHCCKEPRVRGSYLCRGHLALENKWGRARLFVNRNEVREDGQMVIDRRIAGE